MLICNEMTDVTNVIIGVLVPTYNRKEYLRLALSSVCNQTYHDLEIIVIDNGSTDGTAEYMSTVQDRRVKYLVNQENLGLIGSINRGMNLFSPDVVWCTILCDDDMLDRNFVQSMVQFIGINSTMSIVHSGMSYIDDGGKTIKAVLPAPLVESAIDYVRNRSTSRRETYLSSLFFSRKCFEEIGGYPRFTTGMATDDALIFALATKDRLFFNKDAVAYVRMHTGAESHDIFGAVKHILAIGDYAAYVEQVALDSHAYSEKEVVMLRKLVRKFSRAHNSAMWLKNVVPISKQDNHPYASQIADLYGIAGNKDYAFSARVVVDAFFANRCHMYLERSRLYRFFWSMLGKTKNLLR